VKNSNRQPLVDRPGQGGVEGESLDYSLFQFHLLFEH